MKCTIPEISWHNKDPVLSLDIQLKAEKDFYRLATAGSDTHVLIWHMVFSVSGSINLDLAADLTRHQRAVNVVKWSPNGNYLASADDESVIFIWKMKEDCETLNIIDDINEQDKECWITFKVLRGHLEDVYDLSWCSNSLFIASASIDNTVIIWDIQKGKSTGLLDGHKGFVQGVSWDPKNQYIATLCTDRYLRIFDVQTKKNVFRINRCPLVLLRNKSCDDKMERIFHDDTLQTFFRRLTFSPDGNLLVTPSGIVEYDTEAESKVMHTTYIFGRDSLKQPSIVLPSPDEYTVVVTFCPLLFKLQLHNKSNVPIILLPYRMIFAVATKNSVYLYDTQQKIPFGIISNIHYTRLTDMTWSSDGKILAVSSTDGFCSLLSFSDGELGEIYNSEQTEQNYKCTTHKNETYVKNANINFREQEVLSNLNENTSKTKPTQQYEIEANVKNTTFTGTNSDYVSHQSSTFTLKENFLIGNHINSKEQFALSDKKNISTPPIHQDTISLFSEKNKEMRLEHNIITITNEDNQVILGSPDIEKVNEKNGKQNLRKPENSFRFQNELTSDIHLFYEDSQENGESIPEESENKSKDYTEECKIPRRVQLKTISMPKLKK